MKAAVFEAPGKPLEIREVADPTPGPRQLVVAVGACGVCGTDLTMTSGHGVLQLPAGATPGHEYGGEVVAIGAGVGRFSVGDHVVALAIPAACGRCESCHKGDQQWCTGDDKVPGTGQAYAEYTVLGEPQAVAVPPSMPWEDAAMVEPLSVGLHAVDLAGLRPGDDVVVLGAGPIGLGAVYWARRAGARRVVVVATSRRRERFAMALGATTFLVPGPDTVAEAVEAAGGPPAFVFEAAGVPGVLEQAMGIVRPRGTVVVMGCCTEPDSFVPAWPLFKEIRLQFAMTYTAGDYDHVIHTLETENVGPRAMRTSTVALTELPTFFESLRGPNDECKVIVDTRR